MSKYVKRFLLFDDDLEDLEDADEMGRVSKVTPIPEEVLIDE